MLMYGAKLNITERRMVAVTGTVKDRKGQNDQKNQNQRNYLYLVFSHMINSSLKKEKPNKKQAKQQR